MPAGHPIHHHVAGSPSADPAKSGRRHAPHHPTGQSPQEAPHDLTQPPVAPQTTMQWTLSPSRSFVLATLRALHLDPDRGPLLEARATTSTTNIATNLRPHPFTGVPNTAKCECTSAKR